MSGQRPGRWGPPPRGQSPFRGPPPQPPSGWASPVPPNMTQSPPPFLIRPVVGGRGRSPFSPPPNRWSPSTPTPPRPLPPPFFSPPPVFPAGNIPSPFSPPPLLQPSFDMEFVYPAGMDEDTFARRHAAMSIPQESVDEGPSTADIIASQSQDYVDERLAEYQATIQHLQGPFMNLTVDYLSVDN